MLIDGLLCDVKKIATTVLLPSCDTFVDAIQCQVSAEF